MGFTLRGIFSAFSIAGLLVLAGCGKSSETGLPSKPGAKAEALVSKVNAGSPLGTWILDSSKLEFSTAGLGEDGVTRSGPGAVAVFYHVKKIKIESDTISFISYCSVPEHFKKTETVVSSPITIQNGEINLKEKSGIEYGGFDVATRRVECNASFQAKGPMKYRRISETKLEITLTHGIKTLSLEVN